MTKTNEMRQITFIGSLDSTFASRWKKEKFPEQIEQGKFMRRFAAGKYITVEGASDINSRTGQNEKKWRKKWVDDSKSQLKIDKTPVIQEPINSRLEKYKKEKRQQIKYKRKIFIDANQRKELLTNVAKKRKFARAVRTGGKLGLGAVGLAATGALAYGLARKLRSDKGKKRRFYNR